MSKSLTIHDVAQAAGVSSKTVSRVLNGEKYVKADMRERVEATIKALGFRPNFAARALAGKKSFQIALIYDNPSPYYAQNVQAGVMARCAESGYRMIAQPCDAEADNLIEVISALIDQAQLDGVLLTAPLTENAALRALLKERSIPCVLISPAESTLDTASVRVNQHMAAREMTEYLIGQGHQRIGFVAGSPKFETSHLRVSGYTAGMLHSGLANDPALLHYGRYDFASGVEAAEALLALDPRPTAIFASSDEMAAGVLATAHRMGISVPENLSVVGFDDTDLASAVWPPLTTIRQPVRDLGYQATDLLLTGQVEQRVLDHWLINRASVARA
jgi:LacI family transcriptional regulator